MWKRLSKIKINYYVFMIKWYSFISDITDFEMDFQLISIYFLLIYFYGFFETRSCSTAQAALDLHSLGSASWVLALHQCTTKPGVNLHHNHFRGYLWNIYISSHLNHVNLDYLFNSWDPRKCITYSHTTGLGYKYYQRLIERNRKNKSYLLVESKRERKNDRKAKEVKIKRETEMVRIRSKNKGNEFQRESSLNTLSF
jgi:hypothetical protein